MAQDDEKGGTSTKVKTFTQEDLGLGDIDKGFKLMLWNDHVNDMVYVSIALMSICKVTAQEAFNIMMDAHTNGKAIAKTGSLEELNPMKKGLNDMNLEATIES